MGAWGTSLFADDNACDLREDYRDLIGDGLNGPEATDRLSRVGRRRSTTPITPQRSGWRSPSPNGNAAVLKIG